jgi:integrase
MCSGSIMRNFREDPLRAMTSPEWSVSAAPVRQTLDGVRGHRKGENPARWRGHLDKLLPARSKVHKVKHHPALPYDELADFVGALRSQEGVAVRALEFLILTAARTGEVIGARWGEVDLEEKTWIVPAARMKAGREHRVPLSAAAATVLERMKELREGEFVFPGGKKGKPLSNMAMLAVLKRMARGELTAHGFRSSFRDWAAERTNFPHEVAEMALAHTVGDKVEAAYRVSALPPRNSLVRLTRRRRETDSNPRSPVSCLASPPREEPRGRCGCGRR